MGDYTTIVWIHKNIIHFFLLSYIIKTILLFVNRAAFDRLRAKTKAVEMVLGTLILVSGFYLIFMRDGFHETWLIVKIVIVFAALPLAIIGLKRANNILAVAALILFLYAYVVGKKKTLAPYVHKPSISSVYTAQQSHCPDLKNAVMLDKNSCNKIHDSFHNKSKSFSTQ